MTDRELLKLCREAFEAIPVAAKARNPPSTLSCGSDAGYLRKKQHASTGSVSIRYGSGPAERANLRPVYLMNYARFMARSRMQGSPETSSRLMPSPERVPAMLPEVLLTFGLTKTTRRKTVNPTNGDDKCLSDLNSKAKPRRN